MRRTWTWPVILLVSCSSVGSDVRAPQQGSDAGDDEPKPDAPPLAEGPSGTIRVLTYNVAGLPQGVSGSDPLVNTPLMSPLLNAYDLVLAQEDFNYHNALSSEATHPHQSVPTASGNLMQGDGLNRFSMSAFEHFDRVGWAECNGIVDSGNDCLTPKGFTYARHTLAPGVVVDVYNIHTDAGRGNDDYDAREAQVLQLNTYISTNSAGQAVIVAGDTNMKSGDEPVLAMLLDGPSLTDSCVAVSCPEPTVYDRIMYRSSDTVTLTAEDWWDDDQFRTEEGEPLSDHPAIGIQLDWQAQQ